MLTADQIANLSDDELKAVNSQLKRQIAKSLALRILVPIVTVAALEAIIKRKSKKTPEA